MHSSTPSGPEAAPRPLSLVIEEAIAGLTGDEIRFADLVEAFHERGFGMLLMILSAPMALPLPVPPGVNVILASPLLFLTVQQMAGAHRVWLPPFILNRRIKRDLFAKTMNTVLPWVRRIEKFTRPRLGFMTRGIFSHLIGLFGVIMALSVMVPLPLTNTVPSFGICMMAIGVLMRDGLAVLAGAAVGLTWITLLLVLGEAGIRLVLSGLTG